MIAPPLLPPLLIGWQLAGKTALVVGGGAMACQRTAQLRAAGAAVRIVAREVQEELLERAARGEVQLAQRSFEARDLERLSGVDLVVDATNDGELARELAALCRARGLAFHAVDRPELCDFVFPAVHREGPLQIAVSTAGTGPALAGRLRDRIARSLPPFVGRALLNFGRLRQRVRAEDGEEEAGPRRMAWLTREARGVAWAKLASLDEYDLEELVARYRSERDETCNGTNAQPPEPACARRPGRVRLVGAGPGDPGLLTLHAREALERANLVVADRLIPPEILRLVRGELRVARKVPGSARSAQDEIDRWVLDAALAGQDVVRLKAGDPFVYGRAYEELELLRAHGIPHDVVPGVTSAQAASAARAIPATSRGVASRVVTLTGALAEGRAPTLPEFDPQTTYVVYMGVERLGELTARLIACEFPADLPSAVVSRATLPGERALYAPLAELAQATRRAGLPAPAIVFLGAAVALGRFAPDERAPLTADTCALPRSGVVA